MINLKKNKKNTFIIAEIGMSHHGNIGIAHSLIDTISTTGVDAIKFQTHYAEHESSKYENLETENYLSIKIDLIIGKKQNLLNKNGKIY